MYKRTIDITCDWANDCVTIGSESFTLEQLKFEDAPLRQLVKDCLDDTEKAQLRLAYPEWYNELFELQHITTEDLVDQLRQSNTPHTNKARPSSNDMRNFFNKDYKRNLWDRTVNYKPTKP